MHVLITDQNGQILKVNKRFEEASGYNREEIEGKNIGELFQEKDLVFLKGRRKIFEDITLAYLKSGAKQVSLFSFSVQDKIVWLIGEGKEGEGNLLEAILNSIEEGVILEDEDGSIIFVNKKLADWVGKPPSELIGSFWFDLIPSNDRHLVKSNKRLETYLLKSSNEKLKVLVTFKPILLSKNWKANLVTFSDLSEKERREEELREKSERLVLLNRALTIQKEKLMKLTEELEAMNKKLSELNEAKSEFVAAVSHDLRAPLTTIIEGVSLVEDLTLGDLNLEQKKFLRMVLDDAQRLADFINDLLDLSRIESKKIETRKKKFDLLESATKTISSFLSIAKEKGINLINSIPKGLPPVFADENHFNRILTNLLSNALKFTPSLGRVEVRAQKDKLEDLVILTVKDSGIGIPRSQQSKIFQKFGRIEREGVSKEPGTGLGLALCKELVELQGGEIWFLSEEGKGSEFSFSLPIYSEILELKDRFSKVEREAKSINRPMTIFFFTFPSLINIEKFKDILVDKDFKNGLYCPLPSKKRAVLFSLTPPENVLETYKFLMDLSKNIEKEIKIYYQVFSQKEIKFSEFLNSLIKEEK